MDSLTNLISKPLEAATVVLQNAAAAAAGPAAGTAAVPALQGNATFTEDVLRMLLYNLFHGDSRLQQQVCQQYYAPDVGVTFNEDVLALSGQEQLVQLLRGLQLMARFKPEVLEITSTPEKAVILLNLNISYKLLPPTWWFPLPAPATITLTFGRPEGVTNVIPGTDDVITHHHQEMSLLELMMWNPAWEWVNRRFWRPVSGQVLSKLVQFEQPLVSRYASYLSGGAGYIQATLWAVDDLARAVGLRGLTSAAARLTPRHVQRGQQQQQQQQQQQPHGREAPTSGSSSSSAVHQQQQQLAQEFTRLNKSGTDRLAPGTEQQQQQAPTRPGYSSGMPAAIDRNPAAEAPAAPAARHQLPASGSGTAEAPQAKAAAAAGLIVMGDSAAAAPAAAAGAADDKDSPSTRHTAGSAALQPAAAAGSSNSGARLSGGSLNSRGSSGKVALLPTASLNASTQSALW